MTKKYHFWKCITILFNPMSIYGRLEFQTILNYKVIPNEPNFLYVVKQTNNNDVPKEIGIGIV